MSDWLKNLPPENYIYLLGGALLLVLVIVILTYVMRISREIAGKTLRNVWGSFTIKWSIINQLKNN